MINRRAALVAIGAAALSGVGWITPAEGRQSQSGNDDNSSADLAHLGAHVYSEEGIPMFLACVNLAAQPAKGAEPPSALNDKVASAFHRYAAEWHRMRPHAPASDVAKIVELLATRDFASGGTEVSL